MESSFEELPYVKRVFIHDRRTFVIDICEPQLKKNDAGFFLNSVDFKKWKNHRYKIRKAAAKVDDSEPIHVVRTDLKVNMLDKKIGYAQKQFKQNLQLVGRMNFIKNTTGLTDNYARPLQDPTFENLRKLRKQSVRRIANENHNFYYKLQNTRSHNLGAEPKTRKTADYGFNNKQECYDTSSELRVKQMSSMKKYKFRFKAYDGNKIGWMSVITFDKICPDICNYFEKLIEGLQTGESYLGTSIIKILPGMFCTMGDVTKNNGFGGLVNLEMEKMCPEDQKLKHVSAGLLSMEIKDGLADGIFNLTFKAMPLLDGRSIVFGKMVECSPNLLKIIGKMGNSLGQPLCNPFISQCGWFQNKTFVMGKPNKRIVPKYLKHSVM